MAVVRLLCWLSAPVGGCVLRVHISTYAVGVGVGGGEAEGESAEGQGGGTHTGGLGFLVLLSERSC